MKRFFAILLALLVLLTGCSKGVTTGNDGAYREEMSSDKLYADAPAAGKENVAETDQKLIKTVRITAETEALDALLQNLDKAVASVGGYMEQRNVYHGSNYSGSSRRNAELTVRVPADKLDSFVQQMSGLSNIISSNESIENVTLTYVATESRVNALKAEEKRLLELMEKAETMADLLEVESRLTEVRYELERVTSQLMVLENQVSYATVRLSVTEVRDYTVVQEQTVWQRISAGFVSSLEGLWEGIVEVFVFLVVASPYLVVLAAAVTVLVLLLRRKKKASRRRPPFPTNEPPKEAP